MAKQFPWLKQTGLALCACGLGASAVLAARASGPIAGSRPYLLVTGPAPLRFQAPHPLVRATLPPLPPANPNPGPPASLTNSTPPPAATATATNRVSTRPAATVISSSPTLDPALPLPLPEDRNPEVTPAIDPQLLLEYLAPVSTNGPPRAGLSYPPFVPPVAPRPSSRATYESR